MSESTQAGGHVEAGCPGVVVPLWNDVVLDEAAIEAQRLASLAEVTAERYNLAHVRSGERGDRTELAAARHLERGARLARVAADKERLRCAAASGDRVEARPGLL